jgi:two-component system response regulator FlrC
MIHILVTDDDPDMRAALEEVLKRCGWKVSLAENADQGLAMIENDPTISLLITDYRMPGMNGLEFVKQVSGNYPRLPSIMMTAYGTIEDAVTAMKEGVNDYLLKPFSYETVKEVITRVLESTTGENEPVIREIMTDGNPHRQKTPVISQSESTRGSLISQEKSRMRTRQCC